MNIDTALLYVQLHRQTDYARNTTEKPSSIDIYWFIYMADKTTARISESNECIFISANCI